MRFCIGFFKQWQPRLVGFAAFRKIKSPRACLVRSSIFFFCVAAGNRIPDFPFHVGFIIVWGTQVQLIINDTLLPLAI